MKQFTLLISLTLLLILTACGSGGGYGDKTAKVTIGIQRKDNTQGTNVGSVALEITLPAAFVLQTDVNDVNGIPISTKAMVDGLFVDDGSYYTHPILTLGLLKSDGSAFSTGDLVRFSRPLGNGEALTTEESFFLNLIEVTEISEHGDVTIHTQEYEVTLTIEEI